MAVSNSIDKSGYHYRMAIQHNSLNVSFMFFIRKQDEIENLWVLGIFNKNGNVVKQTVLNQPTHLILHLTKNIIPIYHIKNEKKIGSKMFCIIVILKKIGYYELGMKLIINTQMLLKIQKYRKQYYDKSTSLNVLKYNIPLVIVVVQLFVPPAS